MIYHPLKIHRAAGSGSAGASTAFYLALSGLVLYLLISNSLLSNWGIPYDVPGGPAIAKFHPGTYLIFAGFVMQLISSWDCPSSAEPAIRGALRWFALVVMGVGAYALLRYGANGSGFIIDTFIAPSLLGLVLIEASAERRRLVFKVMLVLIFINALIGIVEMVTHSRLIPYMVSGNLVEEDYFRATALEGHPLTNAQNTAQMLLAALIYSDWRQVFLLPILYMATLAFGSRSAFAILSLLLLVSGASYFLRKFIHERSVDIRLLLLGVAILVPMVTVIGVLASQGTLGTRIFDKLYMDDSATSRLVALEAFGRLDLQQLLFGGGPEFAESVFERLHMELDMASIENFWIVLALQLGIIPLGILGSALLLLLYRLAWGADLALKLCAIAFLVLASGSNSLASKSQNVAVILALLIGARAEHAYLKALN